MVRVVDLESLAPHCCGFENRQDNNLATRITYGTSVVLFSAVFQARRGTWCLPLPVKLEGRHITFTVLVRRKNPTKKVFLWPLCHIHEKLKFQIERAIHLQYCKCTYSQMIFQLNSLIKAFVIYSVILLFRTRLTCMYIRRRIISNIYAGSVV